MSKKKAAYRGLRNVEATKVVDVLGFVTIISGLAYGRVPTGTATDLGPNYSNLDKHIVRVRKGQSHRMAIGCLVPLFFVVLCIRRGP